MDKLTPEQVQAQLAGLLVAFADAAYECGDWRRSDGVGPYETRALHAALCLDALIARIVAIANREV